MVEVSDLYKSLGRAVKREIAAKVIIEDITYEDTDVVSFTINEYMVHDDITLGTAIPSVLELSVRMTETPPANAKVQVYLKFKNSSLEDADVAWEDADVPWDAFDSEWLMLGEYFIDSRNGSDQTAIMKLTCYDKLMAGNVVYKPTIAVWPSNQKLIFEDIIAQMGLEVELGTEIIEYPVAYTTDEYSRNEILGYIGGCHGGCFKVGRDGKLRLIKLQPAYDFTDISMKEYFNTPKKNSPKSIKKIVCTGTYNGVEHEHISGIGDEDEAIHINNPYMYQSTLNTVLDQIDDVIYVPANITWRCFPWLECGDWIQLDIVESPIWQGIEDAWEDLDIRLDGITHLQTIILNNTIEYHGGLRGKVDSPGKTLSESEFAYQAPVERKIVNNRRKIYENKAEINVLDDSIQLIVEDVEGHNSLINQQADQIDIIVTHVEGNTTSISLNTDDIALLASDVELNTASINLNAGEIALLVENVDGNTAAIILNTYNITTKVEKDNVISEINQSAEQIKIMAEKIALEGYATFESLSSAGQTAIDGANITTGQIAAARVSTDIAQVNKDLYVGSYSDGTMKRIRFNSSSVIWADNDYSGYLPQMQMSTYYFSNDSDIIRLGHALGVGTDGELMGTWKYKEDEIISKVVAGNGLSGGGDGPTISLAINTEKVCTVSGYNTSGGINILYSDYGVTIQRVGSSDAIDIEWGASISA